MTKKRHTLTTAALIAFVLVGPPLALAGHYVVDNVTTSTNWGAAEWLNYPDEPSATPCTPETAMQNAQAGDTVHFRGGTYNVDGCRYNRPRWDPCNDGTSGAYITFVAYSGEFPIVYNKLADGETGDSTNACPTSECNPVGGGGMATAPLIGARDSSYIIWDGFKTTAKELVGRVVVWNSDHIIIRNCEIVGHAVNCQAQSCDMGNYDGIRIESSADITIENCLIHGNACTDTTHGDGIKIYASQRVEVKECSFFDVDSAIVDKDYGRDNEFHHNFVYGLNVAGGEGSAFRPARIASYGPFSRLKFHHNVVISDGWPTMKWGLNGGDNTDLEVFNNTLYFTSGDYANFGSRVSNLKFWNNVICGASYALSVHESSDGKPTYSDYNCFFNSERFVVERYEQSQAEYNSLSAWKTSGALEGGGNPDVHSVNTDPCFLNDSGTMLESADFKLTSSSPGAFRTGGRGGTHASYIGAWEWPINPSQQIGYSPVHDDPAVPESPVLSIVSSQ